MPNLLAEIAGIPGGALFTLFIIDNYYKKQEEKNWKSSIKILNGQFYLLLYALEWYLKDIMDTTVDEETDNSENKSQKALNIIKLIKNAPINNIHYNNHDSYGIEYLIEKTDKLNNYFIRINDFFSILPKTLKIYNEYYTDFDLIYHNFNAYQSYLKELSKMTDDELKNNFHSARMWKTFNILFLETFVNFSDGFLSELNRLMDS
ncbi:MAG: hypothetical protein WCK67_04365 [bacterium]